MKTKRFVLFLVCIVFTTVVALLFGDPQPSIHNLVTETHTRISNWKNFQVKDFSKGPDPEEKYLHGLGFRDDNPHLYPKNVWANVTLPVFTTGVLPNDVISLTSFFKSFQHYFPDSLLVVYDLGLNPSDLSLLNSLCNSSNCILRKFKFSDYPSHVRNLQMVAYRPIIIQEVLNQAGAVIWIDVSYIFASSDIGNILKQAEKEGLVSWTINEPTSALTHPRMFDYFGTKQEKYFFHRMVEPKHIVMYNTKAVHYKLMLPWVKCALVQNCIAPIGAQNSGCRFDKKPLYRYSGCHQYDTSALNVVLGLMFDFSATRYSAKEEEKFFHSPEPDKLLEFDAEKNSSVTDSI